MSYDRADWYHGAADFPSDLRPENAATHIGMFLAWAIINGLEGELHRTEDEAPLASVRARNMTGREFLIQYCDEKFTDEDLNDEGNAFAASYYETKGGHWQYIEDYERVFSGLPSVYHVEDTWANYDRIAPVISRRFDAWRRRHRRRWWQFWGA